MIVDTHCHLDFEAFHHDRDEVFAHARQNDVGAMINPGVNFNSVEIILKMAEEYEELYAAIGIHPNNANEWDHDSKNRLKHFASKKKVVAIGEIGLDYYRENTSPSKQRHVLENQLQLAAELELPVIIHNREASHDILDMLCEWQDGLKLARSRIADRPGVFHSFSAELDTAQRAVEANFLIGITGPITFKNADMLRNIVKEISLESIIVETDAPFLAPSPKRGRRNQPGYIHFIVEKIAEIHEIPVKEVKLITTSNAKNLFKLGDIAVA